jgi:ABC-type Na+ efflux pump permease subunit
MPMRWGLGPVFACETLLNARRWQVYAARSALVLAMLVGMLIVWTGQAAPARGPGGRSATFRQMAEVGQGFFYALAGIQVSLVLLAAPAAAAGSICMDRARGTLQHMMVTDLSDVEIVAGKLAARLAPVFGLVACGVPVAALAALLGGIEFGALGGAFVVSLALAVFGCALAMAISVRATKTHEVLMAVYMIEGLWLIALPNWWALNRGMGLRAPPEWFQKANPYVLVFAPYNQPGFAGAVDYAAFVGAVLALSAALVVASIATLRRVVVEQSGRAEKAVRRPAVLGRIFPSWAGPTLDGNPVLWREWHRNRPSRLARRLWAILLVVTWIMAAWGTYDIITEGIAQPRPNALVFGFLIQLLFGMLMLSATAPTTLAEERVRGSLDVLLATPLSTRSIVVAKWWGVFRGALMLGLMPLYVGVLLAAAVPDTPTAIGRFPNPLVPLTAWDRIFAASLCMADFLASCAAIVSLGVALATWVPRLGRAVALNVAAYVLAGIGWILLMELLFSRFFSMVHRWLLSTLISLSPIAGPINVIEQLEGYHWESRTPTWLAIAAVVLIKAAVAGMLLRLTIRTFDRCLGRVPESPSPDRAEKPAPLEELATSATGP